MKAELQSVDTIRLPVKGAQTPPKTLETTAQATSPAQIPTAVVYCEGNFGKIDGKTANGLVRHSEAYKVVSIIDSTHSGENSGQVLDEVNNTIPILESLDAVSAHATFLPDTFIYGMAPSTGRLSPADRGVVLDAIARGMNIVSGLHEYLSDDAEIAQAASERRVSIRDIRKPKLSKDMRLFDGSVASVHALRIAVLGTDCAIGKRTTATVLARALNAKGIKTVLVGTGQTGLIQGARYGVALDSVPSQFCAGELEATIVEAFDNEQPDVIIIEGQGALSHPAFSTTSFILRGACPHAVVLQHAPARAFRCDFDTMAMPDPADEIILIETFADTRVIGLTLNHEHMNDDQISQAMARFSHELGIPVTDALNRPVRHLLDMVFAAFPALRQGLTGAPQ